MNGARTARTVAVTGLGLVTPAGVGVEETWQRVCSGRPTAADDPELAGSPVGFSCRVGKFDPREHTGGTQPWRYDRFTQFALAAAREAVDDAALDPDTWDGARVAVVLGSAAGGVATYEKQHHKLLTTGHRAVSPLTLPAFLPNMAAGRLAIDLGVHGPVLQTGTACASGATALVTAAMLLDSDACDIAVAGGSDAMATPLCATAFARAGALSRGKGGPAGACRPFDAARDGFVLAEGAGVLVLERLADATARHASVRSLLAGHGSSTDAHHPVAPRPDGRCLRDATEQALDRAGAGHADVDHVNAHGTGTPLNDSTEAAVLRELYAPDGPTVTSTKGVTGHMMGAAGAVEAALTVLTVQRQTVPPTANFDRADAGTSGLDIVRPAAREHPVELALSNSCGFGGHNVVLAFARAPTARGA
ncbi:beta-ketoacyl-[acyl-carrier-protein] synthase family protein [Streptomyces albus subsp. chlorinus]|uniref:beta-ketoacyl-[acyl-carrier-protein] synthase family protein n=1 Tax=Streptomyces albus TaxID=1888 RepID=UPI00156D5836|nr:beta-ketoacyl-[acyl-carrier-protein] synthase family protein [Streptomyces albus]NSC19876.1 beta-ketoacyl-[acyl-carrier-protein] synthase family protein [Streptomyces albus subsp. chlorinus]